MATRDLGRLERVNLRDIWINETSDFTPWLAQEENLKLLGEAINLDLSLEAQEKNVGPFYADILCKDMASDNWVLIENQLEKTNHTHLGQILTYAAGLKTVTIVWVAEKFTEEHRAALDWLNEVTSKHINFFGLEIEVWRIGNSSPAPKFNVLCKPNNWAEEISDRVNRTELTETKQLQLEFWTAFRRYLEENSSSLRATKPFPQHWMNLALGRGGFQLTAIASLWNSDANSYEKGEVRAEFAVTNSNAKAYFSALEAMRDDIEKDLGQTLTWHNPENKTACRVYLRRDADLNDKNLWPEYHAWLLANLESLRRVFGPRVKQL